MKINKTYCVQIKDNLHLIGDVLDFSQAAIDAAKQSMNYLFVIDRSGSMHGAINKVWDDVLENIRSIPFGSTVTLAWFSSEGGQKGVILKGYKLTEQADFNVLSTTVEKYRNTVAMTCFSEILEELETTLDDLSALGPNFALLFFTDGYPVVKNYNQEVTKILAACQKVATKFSAAAFIGYSHYYNRELLREMAEAIGGSFVHSKDIESLSAAQATFLTAAQNARPKELVPVGDVSQFVPFSVDKGLITSYQPIAGNIGYAPKDGLNMLFRFVASPPKGSNVKKVPIDEVLEDSKLKSTEEGQLLAQALYSAAAGLNQAGKTLEAIDLLGAIGDKRLVDAVTNAFTNDESGVADMAILQAGTDPDQRFLAGRDTSYVPAADALCVVDVMDWLLADPEACFYPRHEAFEYERTGVASRSVEGSLKFTADDNAKCPFNSLTWHKSKLNLSVLAPIKGTVELPDAEAKKQALPNPIPSHIFRNYMIVKDGHLHTIGLPVSLGQETFERMQKAGLIDDKQTYQAEKIYLLRLEGLPVMNRAMAEGVTDIKSVSQLAAEELQLTAALKVLKAKRDELDPEGTIRTEPSPWTPEQETYLESVGIKKGAFSPKTEKEEPVDFYDVRTFEIKIAGCSSLPKVSEVETKLSGGRSLNTPGEIMATTLQTLEPIIASGASMEEKLSQVDSLITKSKDELAAVRKQLQRIKFAVLLARRWFDGYNPKEETSVTLPDALDGVKGKLPLTFSYVIGEERVAY